MSFDDAMAEFDARCQRLDDAGRLCSMCLEEFDPELLETLDLDPGNPEVGPDPDIVRFCADCLAIYNDEEEDAR